MKIILNNFFKNKKVLISGASGFVGRNLFNKMKELEANVTGTFFTNEIEGLTYCDLTNYSEVDTIVKDVDYVFMVAAKTYGAGILKSNPASMVKDTITMDANILEACYKYKVKKILYVSSTVVYQPSYNKLTESDLDWNKNPAQVYMGVGWVKRYIEKLCEFYINLGLSINIVRPTNIYGPYDKYEEGKSHVVPALVKRAIEKQDPYMVWGDGNAVKDFVYIDDFIRDILKIFTREESGIYNLCSENLVTIKELVNNILYLSHYEDLQKVKIVYDNTKPTSIRFKSVSRSKFDSIFGKQHYHKINTGLVHVFDWLRKELNEK